MILIILVVDDDDDDLLDEVVVEDLADDDLPTFMNKEDNPKKDNLFPHLLSTTPTGGDKNFVKTQKGGKQKQPPVEGKQIRIPLSFEEPVDSMSPYFDDETLMEADEAITNDLVEATLMQILTGSVIIVNNTNMNLKDWVTVRMEPLFDNRFLDIDGTYNPFVEWAEVYLDYILQNTDNACLCDRDAVAFLLAGRVLTALRNIGATNVYVDLYIQCLNDYIARYE